MSTVQMNTYVPAHQIRNNGNYLWVKWWSGQNITHAHFHATDQPGEYVLRSISRNGTQIADKTTAAIDDLPDGLLETLRVRYDLAEHQATGESQ